MYKKHKGCKKETICALDCWVPPVGKGVNVISGELEDVEIISSSTKKSDQAWFRTKLPKDWAKRRAAEKERQKENPDYLDQELEEFRSREWHRRLNGIWVMMNGKPVYLTGGHYFYLNWWNIGTITDYRDPDRKYFYFSLYCMLDPECLGINEITKRKQGKTARGGAWLFERISRKKYVWGGIQSKTGEDAKKNVFQKYTINPFKKLPDFFQPIYDTSKGITPSTELRFYKTNRRGQYAGMDDGVELESLIDWRSSELTSYDSQVLDAYVCDEAGKFVDVDVYDLHWVVRFCCEIDGDFKGKMLYTTTVEEMEFGGKGLNRLTKASDQTKREENGRTASGLYTFFTPAYETMFYDKYGIPDQVKGKAYFMAQRKALESDPLAQNAYIRKNPFTLAEAFRVSQANAIYNIIKLNDRLEVLNFAENMTTRGNFRWVDGKRDTRVEFKPMKTGRWEVTWLFPDEKDACNVIKRGKQFSPGNGLKFVTGIDPYDHDTTVDNRRSKGAGITLKKFNAAVLNDPFNFSFTCKYANRPKTAKLFYEDMILQCFYHGSPMLFEDQKIGIKNYFDDRGYSDFMIWLPGASKPGISASPKTHQQEAELTEDYIENYIDKCNFIDLITDWINFDIKNTEKYDLAMAAGYALIGDQIIVNAAPTKRYESIELFRMHKVPH